MTSLCTAPRGRISNHSLQAPHSPFAHPTGLFQTTCLSVVCSVCLAACGDAEHPGNDAGQAWDSRITPDSQASPDGPGDWDSGPTASRIDEILTRLQDPSTGPQLAEEIRHEVAWNEGWPLHEGKRWLFLTYWPDHPPGVSLVGDFNDWTPGRHVAEQAPWGSHLWVVLDDRDIQDPSGQKYKWWAQGPQWRPPPEATAYTYDEYGEVGYVRPPRDRSWLERFPDLTTDSLPIPRTVRARLPAGFLPDSPEAQRARILLMHDGQNLFDPEAPWGGWRLGDILDGGWDDVVVLAVDSVSDRMDVYTHVADAVEQGQEPVGGRADDYLDTLETVILPFFANRYGLAADFNRIMVAGSSLGGLVSLYQAMTRPHSLVCAAALSPTLGWGAYAHDSDGSETLARLWPTEAGHGRVALYVDSGGGVDGSCTDQDGDGIFEDSQDQDNYCVTIQFEDVLRSLGYRDDVDLFAWWEPGAEHNEAAWSARFWRALDACERAGWTPGP